MGAARKKIAVIFGHRSAEHEISVISALQLIEAMDVVRYEPVPVYIASDGRWFSGDALLSRDFYRTLPGSLGKVIPVTLLPDPTRRGLMRLDSADGDTNIETRFIEIEAAILAFHGQYGEDGCMQGLLELADIPYSGCNVLASAVAMNKYVCKSILQAHGVPGLPCGRAFRRRAQNGFDAEVRTVLSTPGLERYPLFVKPCNLGSSIGVSRAHNEDELRAALAKVFCFDSEAIVEPCVTHLMEINVSVLDRGGVPEASVVEIPVSDSGVLTYEEKYMRGGGKKGKAPRSGGMASLTRVINPADLDPALRERVRDHAVKAFTVLGCSGVVRFDFILDTASGSLYFNELNPIPGSLSFYLWVKSKPQRVYTEVLTTIIERAFEVHGEKAALKRDIGFKALMNG